MNRSGNAARLALSAFAAAILAAPSMAAEAVGSVAAANNDITGTPPEAASRDLFIGVEVVRDERVQTSEIGAGQLLFLDKTTLTVWPNSDVVLDQYVYDPERDTGEMSLTFTRGMLRFIGGSITKTSTATINTPVGVIGVRGGAITARIEEGGEGAELRIYNGAGTLFVDGVAIPRNDTVTTLRAGGEPETREATAEDAETLLGEATGEGDGGVSSEETETLDERLADSAIPGENSEAPGALLAPRASSNPDLAGEGATEDGSDPDDVAGLVDDADRGEATIEGAIEDVVDGDDVEPIEPVEPDAIEGRRFVLLSEGADLLVPADERLVTRESNFVDFESFSSFSPPGEPLEGVRAEAGGGSFTFFPRNGDPTSDAFTTTEQGDAPIPQFAGIRIGDPGVDGFAVAAFASEDAQTSVIELSYAGTPTPTNFWAGESPANQARVLRFAVDDLLDATSGGLGDADTLFFVGEPGAPLVGADTDGSKWLFGSLEIDGDGAAQEGDIALFRGEATANRSAYPTANDRLIAFYRDDGTSAPVREDIFLGLQETESGATTFGDAPGTMGFVLAGRQNFAELGDDADDIVVRDGLIRDWEGPDASTSAVGVGFGAFDGSVSEASRFASAAAPSAELASTVAPTVERVFEGGYTATQGFSRTGDGAVSDPYLLRTTRGDGVKVGFSADRNAVVAEFSDLDNQSGSPVTDVNLNWGDAGRNGVAITDDLFGARQTLGFAGRLTGQTASVSGLDAKADLDDPSTTDAFAGVLTSAGLVGWGDLFGGADPSPNYLTWGWWSGEWGFASDNGAADQFDDRQERFHLGAFVTGVPTDIADVSGSSDVVTYRGPTIAHVVETDGVSTASYLDGGSLTLSFDFLEGEGDVEITGILDSFFTGSVSFDEAQPGNQIGGTLTQSGGAGGGVIDGGFFDGLGEPLRAVAGGYTLNGVDLPNGSTASAAGVFGAERTSLLARDIPSFDFTPTAGLIGGRYFVDADTGDVSPGGSPVSPAEAGYVGLTDNFEPFTAFSRADPVDGIGPVVRGETADGGFVIGATTASSSDRRDDFYTDRVDAAGPLTLSRAEQYSDDPSPDIFAADGPIFTLFESQSLANPAIEVALFGPPTPRSFWAQSSTEDPILLVFNAVSAYRGSDRLQGLGERVEALFDVDLAGSGGDLFFLGEPNGQLLPDGAVGREGPVGTSSKWGQGLFVVSGAGRAQNSALGQTNEGAVQTAEGYPTLDTFVQFYGRGAGDAAAGRVGAGYGFTDLGGGVTTVGDEAESVSALATNLQIFRPGTPDDSGPSLRVGFESEWTETGRRGEEFGDALFVTLESVQTIDAATRLVLGADVATTEFASLASDEVTDVLTGGYASGVGYTLFESTDVVSEPYAFRALGGEAVRLGFGAAENAAAAEFTNLRAIAPANGVDFITLNWGGSVMLTDERFVIEHDSSAFGAISAQRANVSGFNATETPGAEPSQDSFQGINVSVGEAGVSGLAEAGALRQDYLRWGWWAGEWEHDDSSPLSDQRERFYPGAYVAGVRADIAEVLAQTDQVTYTGDAVAQVIERSLTQPTAAYLDAGTVEIDYDFAARSGQMTIDGLVGDQFTASLSGETPFGDNHYNGTLNAASGGGSGPVDGSFFRGGGDPVAATAGGFTIENQQINPGADSTLVGVFGAEK